MILGSKYLYVKVYTGVGEGNRGNVHGADEWLGTGWEFLQQSMAIVG